MPVVVNRPIGIDYHFECSVCGAICPTADVDNRPCGHKLTDGVLYAQLHGGMFTEAEVGTAMFPARNIPKQHQNDFPQFCQNTVWHDGETHYWLSDWMDYIERYHAKTLPKYNEVR